MHSTVNIKNFKLNFLPNNSKNSKSTTCIKELHFTN